MPSPDAAIRVREQSTNVLPSPEEALAQLEASMQSHMPGPDSVETKSIDYNTMATRWDLIDDLRGGTLRMRENARHWLPSEEKESGPKYNLRVSRSFLYGAYSEAVDRLSTRHFSKGVTTVGELPDGLDELLTDTDRTGQTLAQQGREFLRDSIHHGLSHILVDFARMPEGANLAEEREAGARPMFVHIPATHLIAWRIEVGETGRPFLSEIRYRENTVLYTGAYKEEERMRIRVYRTNDWELWEMRKAVQDRKNRWFLIEQGTHTFGAIPLVTLYTDRVSYMLARPALEDLAWTNLAHFQSNSEQRNLLRFARIGILFASGFEQEKIEAGLNISPTSLIGSTNPESDLKYVEHEGGAMEIGAKDLDRLERQMDILALKPIILPTTGTISATGQAIEESKSQSALQTWVRATEMVYLQAFQLAAKWTKSTLPKDFKMDIFNDFAISPRVRDDVLALLEARGMGEISRKTLLEELQRRDLIAEHRDIDKEVEEAKKDMPEASGSIPPRVGGTGFNMRGNEEGSRLAQRDKDPNANQAGSPRP